jgi:hypothetical protein
VSSPSCVEGTSDSNTGPSRRTEAGIYLPEFGVRSEVNMLVRSKAAEVTGKIQREIVTI